jgi:hypothetical protein
MSSSPSSFLIWFLPTESTSRLSAVGGAHLSARAGCPRFRATRGCDRANASQKSAGRSPSPFKPVIFSMQLDDSARCLQAFSEPRELSILAMGGSCPYRSTFSASAATHCDLASNALMASLIEVCAAQKQSTITAGCLGGMFADTARSCSCRRMRVHCSETRREQQGSTVQAVCQVLQSGK